MSGYLCSLPQLRQGSFWWVFFTFLRFGLSEYLPTPGLWPVRVYCDFTGFSEPGLSIARGRICSQKGKLMVIHAETKNKQLNVQTYRTVWGLFSLKQGLFYMKACLLVSPLRFHVCHFSLELTLFLRPTSSAIFFLHKLIDSLQKALINPLELCVVLFMMDGCTLFYVKI